MPLHPADVLFAGEKPFPSLPAVDHYAGAEKLMLKALKLQQELGPVFDITCDCEDGARAGAGAMNAIGTAVTGGMLSATFIDLVFIPLFFVVISRTFAKKRTPAVANVASAS